jgi:WD40 repeat protein
LGSQLRVWDYTSDKEHPTQLKIAQNVRGDNVDLQLDPSGQWFAFSRVSHEMGDRMSDRMSRIFVGRIDSQFSIEPIEGARIPGRVQALAFVPGRAQLAFTSEEEGNREIHFVDLNTKQIVRKLPLLLPGEKSNSSVFNLRVSVDGTRFASISHDGRRVIVYDTDSGRRLYLLPAGDGTILWLAWHPHGTQLAVARDDGDISLWNLPAVDKALADAGLVR